MASCVMLSYLLAKARTLERRAKPFYSQGSLWPSSVATKSKGKSERGKRGKARLAEKGRCRPVALAITRRLLPLRCMARISINTSLDITGYHLLSLRRRYHGFSPQVVYFSIPLLVHYSMPIDNQAFRIASEKIPDMVDRIASVDLVHTCLLPENCIPAVHFSILNDKRVC